MPEVEYLIVYEDMDRHWIVFEKNSETRMVDPVMRFVNKYHAYEYFEKLGFDLINPRDANTIGIRDGDMVWVRTPEGASIKVMSMITERVAAGVAFLPFHFGGHYQGEDQRHKYPEGADPYVLGEAANTAMTYGYDSVTQMQESKCSLCLIERA